MKLKISIDLDDTIVSFYDHYISRFGQPKTDLEITKKVMGELLKDREFWLTQPLINFPNFTPTQYTTARLIPKLWIKKQLEINNLPKSPIYQVMGVALSKAKMLRGRVDVHIDDSLRVFKDLNSNIALLIYSVSLKYPASFTYSIISFNKFSSSILLNLFLTSYSVLFLYIM